MPPLLRRFARLQSLLLACVLLMSCGGGGGGGGGGASSRITLQPGGALTFTMTYGAEAPAARTVQVSFQGDGLVVGYAPGLPAAEWLVIHDVTTGSPSHQASIRLQAAGNNHPGTYTTQVRFATANSDGSGASYVDLPVTLIVKGPSIAQPSVIYAGRNGIALTSLPDLSRLTDTVNIYTTASSMGALAASSNAAWLAASASGNSVSVSADPAGLESGMHYATVTVTSSVIGMASTTLRVGLFVGASAPADGTSVAVATTVTATVAVDPVRPWVYVANAPSTGRVSAVNIYTGAVDAEFASITSATTLTSLTVSSDGRYLFAHGYGGTTFHKLDIDANSWTDFTVAAQETHVGPIRMYYLRPAGRPVLLTDTGVLVDATSNTVLNSTELPRTGEIYLFAISDDQRRIARLQNNVNGASIPIYMFWLDYYPASSMFIATFSNGGGPFESLAYAGDLAMNRAGTRLHATGNMDLVGYHFDGFLTTPIADFSTIAHPYSIAIDPSGTAYFAVTGQKMQAYSPDGTLLKEFTSIGTSVGDEGLQISADGQLVLAMSPAGGTPGYGNATSLNLKVYRTVQ